MFSFLKPKVRRSKVPQNEIMPTYKRYRLMSLLGVFLGYMAYYIVRNHFTLSTPHLKEFLNIDKAHIGYLASCVLVSYGLSKGYMSSLADKADPKRFMALGLFLCCCVSVGLAFSPTYTTFVVLAILLGTFQGMGVGPAFITIANWYPRKERGMVTAFWNISHNIGGGLVAPVVGLGTLVFAGEKWQLASYIFPAMVALSFCVIILLLVKGKPEDEGLPHLNEIIPDEHSAFQNVPHRTDLSSWQIFMKYVFVNKHAWYVSLVDTFVYVIRFGLLTWLPIYLLQTKGFTKVQMGTAFLIFEWAAIPSTMLAGLISDRLFKGYRMPPAIIATAVVFVAIIGYFESTSIAAVTFFAALAGCFIYIPQFLASVQTMEVVPSYAVGSAVGLRGFMSYVVGAVAGTSLLGKLVDLYGWNAGFYLLLSAAVLCMCFAYLSHRGMKELLKED